MEIREAREKDLPQLLELYTHLHDNPMPAIDAALESLWQDILADKNHHVVVGLVDDTIVSSCVIIIVPNLTRNQRPYAFIENVITHPEHRNKGYATRVMDFARAIARANNCYKIMLMTSSKLESTHRFYEKAGYNSADKTAFVQWM
jgi:ribosomal protein S18 acetylase RimI-like enzyme